MAAAVRSCGQICIGLVAECTVRAVVSVNRCVLADPLIHLDKIRHERRYQTPQEGAVAQQNILVHYIDLVRLTDNCKVPNFSFLNFPPIIAAPDGFCSRRCGGSCKSQSFR